MVIWRIHGLGIRLLLVRQTVEEVSRMVWEITFQPGEFPGRAPAKDGGAAV